MIDRFSEHNDKACFETSVIRYEKRVLDLSGFISDYTDFLSSLSFVLSPCTSQVNYLHLLFLVTCLIQLVLFHVQVIQVSPVCPPWCCLCVVMLVYLSLSLSHSHTLKDLAGYCELQYMTCQTLSQSFSNIIYEL